MGRSLVYQSLLKVNLRQHDLTRGLLCASHPTRVKESFRACLGLPVSAQTLKKFAFEDGSGHAFGRRIRA
jgi:hypothetical protein